MCEAEGCRCSGGGSISTCRDEGREDVLTPLPLGEVRVCCWVIEVSAEHGFSTRMEVIGEHQRWGKNMTKERVRAQKAKESATVYKHLCPALCSLNGLYHHETMQQPAGYFITPANFWILHQQVYWLLKYKAIALKINQTMTSSLPIFLATVKVTFI